VKQPRSSTARRFVVVATGARTPVGLCAPMSAASVRAGICRHALHPTMLDGAGDPLRCAPDGLLEPDLHGSLRAQAFALTALQECLDPLAALGSIPLSLWVGLPEERPGWSRTDTDAVMRVLTDELMRGARPEDVMSVPLGHASGLVALALALRELDADRTAACVVGGIDTYLHPATLDWLDEAGRLDSATNRSAFVPGEAACFFVVTTDATARAWRLPELATIRGVATTLEPNPLASGRVCTGEALTAAIAGATQSLHLPQEKVATMYCDINGERHRSEEFFYVPLRLPAPFVDANRYESPVDAWGDVGAASGPLYVALAVASAQRGYARGPHVLAWTASDGGTRAAATLTVPHDSHREHQR
jgi:3-oxoacyl-[acyl-carrier-protein] synthase-1